jgi:hypothetical protein
MSRSTNPFLTAAVSYLWFGERNEDEKPLLDLAIRVRDAIPHVDADGSKELQTILAQSILANPQVDALHDIARSYAPDAVVPTSPEEIVELHREAGSIVRRSRQESSRADPQAIETIQNAVDLMKQSHPELNLSFGYVGNLPSNGWDERSWRIFTQLASPNSHGACDVSFGGCDTRDLPAMATRVTQNLKAWCDRQSERLAAGEIRSLASRTAA